MATVKIILDKRYASQDKTYPVVIRVHHKGERKYVPIGFKVKDSQFKEGAVIKHSDAKVMNSRIASKFAEANKYLADCNVHGKKIRLDLIGTDKNSYSFTDYLSHRARQYKENGQIVMWQKLTRFVKELQDHFGGDVLFEDITPDSLRTFESYLKKEIKGFKKANSDNTRHKKFKFLQEYYSKAIEEGKAESPNPFKSHKINKKPVLKEKLSKAEIAAIEDLDLSKGPINDARNLFLFSYYAKGSRFANCVTLLRKQIHGGRVHIKMNKGEKYISVKMHGRLEKILNQYKGKHLVFPFLEEIPEDPQEFISVIGGRNTTVNKSLKVIAALCEIKVRLTFHAARHSFADHLKQTSDNINVIQDALGHSDQRTTQIYVKSLGDERLDKEMEKLYGQ